MEAIRNDQETCKDCGKILLMDEIIAKRCISCFIDKCDKMEEEQ